MQLFILARGQAGRPTGALGVAGVEFLGSLRVDRPVVIERPAAGPCGDRTSAITLTPNLLLREKNGFHNDSDFVLDLGGGALGKDRSGTAPSHTPGRPRAAAEEVGEPLGAGLRLEQRSVGRRGPRPASSDRPWGGGWGGGFDREPFTPGDTTMGFDKTTSLTAHLLLSGRTYNLPRSYDTKYQKPVGSGYQHSNSWGRLPRRS